MARSLLSAILIVVRRKESGEMKKAIIGGMLAAGSLAIATAQHLDPIFDNPIHTRWQNQIGKPIEGTNGPPLIVYEKSSRATNAVALIKVRYGYKTNDGKVKMEEMGFKYVELPVPHTSGVIRNQDWFFLTSVKLAVMSIGGTGTVDVALFEPTPTPSEDGLGYGRQLSNWLPLPLDRGPSEAGPIILRSSELPSADAAGSRSP
jgi:hypothetical protein